ncbi:MAG: hypothetical protein GC165_13075 [Armatimonadetes bacterium]|nr:hypothetical protein [Armatimonadota bacterium]
MNQIGYNTEIAMELTARAIFLEAASRRFGFRISGPNEVEYMFHSLSWERTDSYAEATLWLLKSNFDDEETMMHVVVALSTIPCVENVSFTDQLASYVIVRLNMDLSDNRKLWEWLQMYRPIARCNACGGEYEFC